MTRFERAFAILLLLGDRRMVTATDLARRFEVSVRTIYRDIDMLGATGVPVYAERGSAGGYRLLDGYFMPPVAFTRPEAVALLLGLTLLRALKASPFGDDQESAERKLVASLPPRLRPLLAETPRLIGFEAPAKDLLHPEPPGPPDNAGLEARAVELFLNGVLDGTRVRMHYETPYNPAGGHEIEAAPAGLLWDRDRWYLIGRRLKPGVEPSGLRFWRADRVGAIELSTMRSDREGGFDVRQHLGRVWLEGAMAVWARSATVRIRLTPDLAGRMAEDWYFGKAPMDWSDPLAPVMTHGDNDPALIFELLRWLGPGAELLEPVALRARFRDELLGMAARYQEE